MAETTMAYQRLNITLPKEIVTKLKKISDQEHRTVSNMILHLIESYKK